MVLIRLYMILVIVAVIALTSDIQPLKISAGIFLLASILIVMLRPVAVALRWLWRSFHLILSMIQADIWRANGRCISCGYDLTGNVSGVCPECANKVKSEHSPREHDNPPTEKLL
ncbi:MAG TPA: hypothetical protein VH370_05115 [Humisphaera sp.]|jgi:uncharacterized paraquat-inducible protein A|nr:hypothetical protein [Humisphaera sp.]